MMEDPVYKLMLLKCYIGRVADFGSYRAESFAILRRTNRLTRHSKRVKIADFRHSCILVFWSARYKDSRHVMLLSKRQYQSSIFIHFLVFIDWITMSYIYRQSSLHDSIISISRIMKYVKTKKIPCPHIFVLKYTVSVQLIVQ